MICQSCLQPTKQAYLCGFCQRRHWLRSFVDSRDFARWRFEQEANLRARRTFWNVSWA